MVTTFLLSFGKRLIGYLAAKLLSPEAIVEIGIKLFKEHAEGTESKSDDEVAAWLEKHLGKGGTA
ncbi:hypothetical protein VPAG_00012 [Vibrio phage douglas 12A4]|uniref:hypothetical protein n=1 Tax=Vibrio phage douglas 12A4 TaxID=573171 RepID=UPI0002C08E98|nr:hypothetical protein VPAG_00012 [Vibrio phage douglas 12A4]AGG58048.1 hypothetical protein VPAG_00012 [Vibrio phage douglas 12A4]